MLLPLDRLSPSGVDLPVPDPVTDALAQVRSWIGPSGAVSKAGTAEERGGWLLALRTLADSVEVAFTQALQTFDAQGDATVISAAQSSAAWLRHEARIAAGDASTRVRIARDAPLLAAPLEAAAAGELRFEHVRAMSAALRPLMHEPALQQGAVPLLRELAERTDPATVRAAGRRLREVVDPDGALTARERQLERRCLTLSPLLDGMTAVDGVLDAESTSVLTAALSPLMVPAGPTDIRSTGQRRADALTELASLALRTGALPQLSGSPAALDVLVPWSVLAGANSDHAPTGTQTGSRAVSQAGLLSLDALRGGLVRHHPGEPAVLHETEVRRIACDAQVGRIVLGPGSVPLDLGRRVRLFSADQRRALSVRDAGCRFPGCDRPPRFTDAHHLVSWLDGGCTDLANALLLCRWHHGRVHRSAARGGWVVTAADAGRGADGPLVFVGPGDRRLVSDPRGP